MLEGTGELEEEKFRVFMTPPKKIILILIDTLREDHLGCYGYKRNTSPNTNLISAPVSLGDLMPTILALVGYDFSEFDFRCFICGNRNFIAKKGTTMQ